MLALVLVLSLVVSSSAFHDSLNFVLQPKTRQCFYENFEASSPFRTVETFVQSGGNSDVLLTVHGPLELDDIRNEQFEEALIRERVTAKIESQSETLTYQFDFKPKSPGSYAICLDNRESRFFPKLVQLDVRISTKPEPIVLQLGGDYSKAEEEELATKAKEVRNDTHILQCYNLYTITTSIIYTALLYVLLYCV